VAPEFGGYVGAARLLMLGAVALTDLLSRRPLSAAELERTGIGVNLSDQFVERAYEARISGEANGPSNGIPAESVDLLPRLLKRCRISIRSENQALYYGGHSGVVQALADAVRLIQAGAIDRCLIAGIDSCVGARFLQAAAAMAVLRTGDNPVGFLPGEAAAFFLLERDTGTRHAVAIEGAAVAEDSAHQFSAEPPVGIALTQAISQATAANLSSPVDFIIGDLNGLERRAFDWGCCLTRLPRAPAIQAAPCWLPAASFGETGAASGAAGVCLAVTAFRRGYSPGNRALLWSASHDRRRAAMVLRHKDNFYGQSH
jgi:3-oxoacyl-[acyl-carrier-protein] synthase-1